MSLHNKQKMMKKRSPRERYWFSLGLKEAGSTFVATGIWGFVTGIAMVKSGLTEAIASLMTLFVYAGSAQLTSLPLIESSAPLWLIVAAGTIVNIRFVIFGAALQPFFRHLPWYKRLLLGYTTTDISFVLFMSRFGEDKTVGRMQHVWYFTGIIVPSWLVWQSSSLLGIYLGGFIPSSWGLEFAAILALLAVVMPLIKTSPFLVCLVVAGFTAWCGQLLPLRLGLVASVVMGVLAGVVTEQLIEKRRA